MPGAEIQGRGTRNPGREEGLLGCVWLVLNAYSFLFVLRLFFGHVACGILVSQPEIESVPPAVKAFSLNHWITREVPEHLFLKHFSGCYIIFTIKRKNRREMRAIVNPALPCHVIGGRCGVETFFPGSWSYLKTSSPPWPPHHPPGEGTLLNIVPTSLPPRQTQPPTQTRRSVLASQPCPAVLLRHTSSCLFSGKVILFFVCLFLIFFLGF